MIEEDSINIIVVGLGYAGLPLAVEFGKKYLTSGFDIDPDRIMQLAAGYDKTGEITKEELCAAEFLHFENNLKNIQNGKKRTVYIIAVQTPVDEFKRPDLQPLLLASAQVGEVLEKNDVVIYESTVYPGCTEENCAPVLEEKSGLRFNTDFYCGYSPERINPGDKVNTLTDIIKLTSGSTPEVADFVDNLYSSILKNGTYKASSIKVAEAAKLVENCQRDINISFVNELAMICDTIGLDVVEVLKACETKWNFLKFRPGLVGGHCISVDPYYMIHLAEKSGYTPNLLKSSREINENMPVFIANRVVKKLISKGISVSDASVLIKGFAYKSGTSDFRNTKVFDLYKELTEFGINVTVFDPLVDKQKVKQVYGFEIVDTEESFYDLVILAHEAFEIV